MKRSQPTDKTCPESEIYEKVLSLDGKNILELGCGKADLTRLIATSGPGRQVTATEVDEIQHDENLLIDDLPNVTFVKAGSEAIPADDESFDVIFMFKSLHHVPSNLLRDALIEAKRVLKPGGMAYISEPIFDGNFNEVLRLFHDEEKVRAAAFAAVKQFVDDGELSLVDELFFNTPIHFEDFEEYERKVINATHSDHQLSAELFQEVRDKFSGHLHEGGADFLIPIRVDLLQKKV